MRTTIKSRMSSKFSQVHPWSAELAALERLKKSPYTYNGRDVVNTPAPSFVIGSSSFLQLQDRRERIQHLMENFDKQKKKSKKEQEKMEKGKRLQKKKKETESETAESIVEEQKQEIQKPKQKPTGRSKSLHIGWLHKDQTDLQSVTMSKGGGNRSINYKVGDFDTEDSVIALGQKLFFPKGKSHYGFWQDMTVELCNKDGDVIKFTDLNDEPCFFEEFLSCRGIFPSQFNFYIKTELKNHESSDQTEVKGESQESEKIVHIAEEQVQKAEENMTFLVNGRKPPGIRLRYTKGINSKYSTHKSWINYHSMLDCWKNSSEATNTDFSDYNPLLDGFNITYIEVNKKKLFEIDVESPQHSLELGNMHETEGKFLTPLLTGLESDQKYLILAVVLKERTDQKLHWFKDNVSILTGLNLTSIKVTESGEYTCGVELEDNRQCQILFPAVSVEKIIDTAQMQEHVLAGDHLTDLIDNTQETYEIHTPFQGVPHFTTQGSMYTSEDWKLTLEQSKLTPEHCEQSEQTTKHCEQSKSRPEHCEQFKSTSEYCKKSKPAPEHSEESKQTSEYCGQSKPKPKHCEQSQPAPEHCEQSKGTAKLWEQSKQTPEFCCEQSKQTPEYCCEQSKQTPEYCCEQSKQTPEYCCEQSKQTPDYCEQSRGALEHCEQSKGTPNVWEQSKQTPEQWEQSEPMPEKSKLTLQGCGQSKTKNSKRQSQIHCDQSCEWTPAKKSASVIQKPEDRPNLVNDSNPTVPKINFKDLSLGAEIGKGAFGVVKKADWLGTTVAVKEILVKRMKLARAMIERELNVHSAVRHPNILQLLAYTTYENKLLLVTEFIDGKNLDDLLFGEEDTVQTWTFTTKVTIAAKIVQAVAYLHNQTPSIIHRDIKPENVLVSKDYNAVRLCDYGLSKIKTFNTVVTTVAGSEGMQPGTPAFQAPEVLVHKKSCGTKTDVWSLAGTIVELLSEQPLWVGDEDLVVSIQKKMERHNMPDGMQALLDNQNIPTEIGKVLDKCLCYDPDKRPSALELLQILRSHCSL